jgi:curved DNA-binding protein
LSDPEKRKKYDQYGKDWQHAEQFDQQRTQRAGQQHYEQQYYDGETDSDFSSFFESCLVHQAAADKQNYRGQIITRN